MNDRGAKLIKRHSRRKSDRTRHEHVWRECFDYVAPHRGLGFDGQIDNSAGADQSKRARIMSSVAMDAAQILTANIVAGIVPANSRWFEIDVDGSNDFERRWLSDASDIIWRNIHASNFDAEVFDAMFDSVAAGWHALYIDEDREKGGFTFECWPISQLTIDSSRPGGRIDIVEREYRMTAEQCVAVYGRDKVSDKVRQLAEQQPDSMISMLHVIEPRRVNMPGAILAKNLPVASVTLEISTGHIVRESGYHEMPVIVPRWERLPAGPYSIGPVATALPDIRLLNRLRANELSATELAVAGMWIAEDDGVLNPKTVRVGPRRVIVANSVDSMKPLLTGSDFNVAFTAEERLERAIRKRLLADQLQPQDGPAMTATEVHMRVGLIRQLLGPIFGRMQAEFLQPLVERCFGLAYRAGVLGQAPESLGERNYHVKYLSPLARGQMVEDAQAIERYSMFIQAQVQGGFAEAGDLYDPDEAARAISDAYGVPKKIVPDSRTVEAKRQARRENQQQQMQAEQQMATQQSMTDAMAKRMAAA